MARFHERCVQLGNSLSPSPIPKVGHDYLELDDLPEAVIAEVLGREYIDIMKPCLTICVSVGFVFVNIMRRTRFDLPRYQFPLVDGNEVERQSVSGVLSHVKEQLANFRRNTL